MTDDAQDASGHDPESVPHGRRVFARTFSSLGIRNFRLFFFGQLISNSGNWLTNVALTLLVLDRTGSGVAVGWMVACQYGPLLIMSAWAGVIADRMNKRHLLYFTQTLEMAESVVLGILAFIPHSPLLGFYLVAVAGGCLLAFDNPARRSFVNEMVPASEVTNAVTLYSSMVNLSRVVGPAIAGVLVVTVGFGWCFTFDAISYLAVLAALVMMRASELRPSKVAARARGQVRAGVRYIASIPELWVSFMMLLIIGLLSYNFNVVFPIFVESSLHGTALQYTLVYSSFSIGAVVGTLFVARRTTITLRTIIVSAAAFGLAMIALFFVPNVPIAYIVAALVGAASVSYMTATTALGQLRADRQMIGRVVAIQTVLQLGTTPIGGPLMGYVADLFGGRVPLLIGGVAALAACIFGLLAGRRFLTTEPRIAKRASPSAS